MARIKLAHWHRGAAPGDVVEVPDDELPALRRDGRVAEILAEEPRAATPPPDQLTPATEPATARRSRKGAE